MGSFVADGGERYAQALQDEARKKTRELRGKLVATVDAAERKAIRKELAQVLQEYKQRLKLLRYALF